MIDPEEGLFRSNSFRICAHCLGDINPEDNCTYRDGEIMCMKCLADRIVEAIFGEDEGGVP